MRQGNDCGTPYRSVIYTSTQQQLREALDSRDQYQKVPHRPTHYLAFQEKGGAFETDTVIVDQTREGVYPVQEREGLFKFRLQSSVNMTQP